MTVRRKEGGPILAVHHRVDTTYISVTTWLIAGKKVIYWYGSDPMLKVSSISRKVGRRLSTGPPAVECPRVSYNVCRKMSLPLDQLVVKCAVTEGTEELVKHTQTWILESGADPLSLMISRCGYSVFVVCFNNTSVNIHMQCEKHMTSLMHVLIGYLKLWSGGLAKQELCLWKPYLIWQSNWVKGLGTSRLPTHSVSPRLHQNQI